MSEIFANKNSIINFSFPKTKEMKYAVYFLYKCLYIATRKGHKMVPSKHGLTNKDLSDAIYFGAPFYYNNNKEKCDAYLSIHGSIKPDMTAFINKMIGNLGETKGMVFSSLPNSKISPLGKLRHNSEYDIDDKEEGSPDLIYYDEVNNILYLVQVKNSASGYNKLGKAQVKSINHWYVNFLSGKTGASIYKKHPNFDGNPKRIKKVLISESEVSKGGQEVYDIVFHKDSETSANNINYAESLDNAGGFYELCLELLEREFNDLSAEKSKSKKTKKLFPYQKNYVAEIKTELEKNGSCIANSPCATGKSVMLRHFIFNECPKRSVHILGTPLLGLGYQHYDGMNESHDFVSLQISSDYTFTNDDPIDDSVVSYKGESIDKFKSAVCEYITKGYDKPMVIFLSEQIESFKKSEDFIINFLGDEKIAPSIRDEFELLMSYGICNYDESHNLVYDGENKRKCPEKKKYNNLMYENLRRIILYHQSKFKWSISWTATPKVSTDIAFEDYDMHTGNTLFGNAITLPYDIAYRAGAIVPIKLYHMIEKKKTNQTDAIMECIDREYKNEAYIKNFGIKTLVFMKGAEDLHEQKDKLELKLKEKYGFPIKVFFVKHNTMPKNREMYYKEFGEARDAVLLNYRIIGEGKDLPDINIVVNLRKMNEIGTIQAFGRGARVNPYDREEFLTDKNKFNQLENGCWDFIRKPHVAVYQWIDGSEKSKKSLGVLHDTFRNIGMIYKVTPDDDDKGVKSRNRAGGNLPATVSSYERGELEFKQYTDKYTAEVIYDNEFEMFCDKAKQEGNVKEVFSAMNDAIKKIIQNNSKKG